MKTRNLPIVIAALAAALGLSSTASAFDPWGSSSMGSYRNAPLTGVMFPSSGRSSADTGSSFTFGRQPAPAFVGRPSIDAGLHPAMFKASRIADSRALDHSTLKCWRFVKTALVESGSVSSYPQTCYAKEAGADLTRNYGFVKLPVRNPYKAPLGSVLVYGGNGAGHVELRTTTGFVSDYRARRPCRLPFIGAFAKVSSGTAQVEVSKVPRS